ncbi:winged helix-turn-helix domain-containing protein [uncultured Methanobrevibacter sp.]|uniref:winged helix-turn-helix domain-containing protein n=1 Tax=uncultured Methanobrevibacter sp. TaxID=253161 RepID=UPI00263872BF|nr:winged helix-turn-helix domain-containing protein [uncultured Methanobrevibacter sp.]
MNNDINDEETWNLIGFVKISPYRYQVMKALEDDYLMPSEIARITGMKASQASNALMNLKGKGLVECLNESANKGRLYQNTELGIRILNLIDRRKTRV